MFENTFSVSQPSDAAVSDYFSKVYAWMTGALALSGGVAWYAANSMGFMEWVINHQFLFYSLMIAELGLVIVLSALIRKMSYTTAMLSFIAYAVLTGLTLSTIFWVYTTASIGKVFAISGGLFAAMSLYGFTTKKDLSGWGSFLIMSLIGIILASIVNFFLQSPMIDWVVTYAGIIIFIGLTAYDTQKLKSFAHHTGDMLGKMAILGALTLYLDFINLFLHLLRAIGDRR